MLSDLELDKLSKADMVKYIKNLSSFHEKFDELKTNLRSQIESMERDISSKLENLERQLTTKISYLESQLSVAQNTSNLLREDLNKLKETLDRRISVVERQAFRSAEYDNYETLEVSKIPISIPDAEVSTVTLKIINALNEPNDDDYELDDVHAIHRRQGKYTREKVLVKFIRRGDAFTTLKRAKKLKNIDLKAVDERLLEKVFINEHLSPYYSSLRYACKLIFEMKLIKEFWTSGHKVKVKLLDDEIKIISHKDDLLNLTTGTDISSILTKCKL